MKRILFIFVALLFAVSTVAAPASAMNKKKLAAKLASKTQLSQVKALEIINIIFAASPAEGIIATELDAGRKVQIPGFGTFAVVCRSTANGETRPCAQPEAGEVGIPVWKPAPELVAALNPGAVSQKPQGWDKAHAMAAVSGSGDVFTAEDMALALEKKAALIAGMGTEVLVFFFAADTKQGIIATELDAGRKVVIPGFGTFGTRDVMQKVASDPQFGVKPSVVVRHVPYFKPGKTLRERVAQ